MKIQKKDEKLEDLNSGRYITICSPCGHPLHVSLESDAAIQGLSTGILSHLWDTNAERLSDERGLRRVLMRDGQLFKRDKLSTFGI